MTATTISFRADEQTMAELRQLAEAILTLRAVIANGDFEEYWRFHLACEHQRLYPGTNQGQCALGA
jgi:hypothetical protein